MNSLGKTLVSRKVKKWIMYYGKRWLPVDVAAGPPVFINSVPKSGTHLLYQIFEHDQTLRDFGEFLSSTPSFTMRELPEAYFVRRLNRVRQGELLRGHLFFGEQVKSALKRAGIIHYFIYRDPRDVVCSEAHYLANMNRWHRMHSSFAGLADQKDRIALAIDGMSNAPGSAYYPNISIRFRRFSGWLKDSHTHTVRFEDMVGEGKKTTMRSIMDYHSELLGLSATRLDQRTAKAVESIDPSRSHTFRKGGGARSWERLFDERLKDRFKAVAGELLVELGYEKDFNW